MKKLIAVLFLSFGFIIQLSAQGKWEWITPYPVGNYPGYSSQADGRVFYVGNNKTFFYTSDGGNSFQVNDPYQPLDNVTSTLNICFSDSVNGFIFDYDGMFRSTDGGKSWSRSFSSGYYFDVTAFGSPNTGWVYGASAGLYKTTNAGETWQNIYSNLINIKGDPNCIYALNEDSLWICKNFYYNAGGAICFSSNGGSSWVVQNAIVSDSNHQVNYNEIKISNSGIGIAVGKTLIVDAHPHYIAFILRTTDFGSTWQQVPVDTTLQLKTISNINDNEWLILGNTDFDPYPVSPPFSLRSSDGGATWIYKTHIFNREQNNYVYNAEYIKKDDILLVSISDGIYRSFDRGVTFNRLSNESEIPVRGFVLDKYSNSENQVAVIVSAGDSMTVSEDGGRSWQKKHVSGIGHFTGNVAVAENIIFAGTSRGLYKSVDLGVSWTQINNDPYGFQRLTAYDKNNLVYLTWIGYSVELMYTTNGGDNWNRTPFFQYSRDLQLLEGGKIYSCGYYYDTTSSNQGFIYFSADYGHNWKVIDFGSEVEKIGTFDKNTALAISHNILYRTSDSGKSWSEKSSNTSYVNFAFEDTLQGILQIGTRLYKTSNAGVVWSPSNLNPPLWGSEYMEYNNRGDLIMVGDKGMCLYKNENYSPGGKGTSGTNIPLEFSLDQNYPNPFNSTTQISWQTPASGRQTLKVYDVLGREVAELFSGFQSEGKHTAAFNAENLASGIYIYRLEAGKYTSSKKMILLK